MSQGPISTSSRPSLDDDAARAMDAELVEVEWLRAAVQARRLRQAVACQQRLSACGARELAVAHLALTWQLSEARVGALLHQGRYLRPGPRRDPGRAAGHAHRRRPAHPRRRPAAPTPPPA